MRTLKYAIVAGCLMHALGMVDTVEAQAFSDYPGMMCVESGTQSLTAYASGYVYNGHATSSATVWCPHVRTSNSTTTYCWTAFIRDNDGVTGDSNAVSCRLRGRSDTSFSAGTSVLSNSPSTFTGDTTLSEDETYGADIAVLLECTLPDVESAAHSLVAHYQLINQSCPI